MKVGIHYFFFLFLLPKPMTISYPWESSAVTATTTQSSTEDEMVSISLLNLSYWTIMIHENSGTPYSCVAHNLACNWEIVQRERALFVDIFSLKSSCFRSYLSKGKKKKFQTDWCDIKTTLISLFILCIYTVCIKKNGTVRKSDVSRYISFYYAFANFIVSVSSQFKRAILPKTKLHGVSKCIGKKS